MLFSTMILVVVIAVSLIGVPDHLTGAMVDHLAVEVEVGNLCIISLSVKFVDALVILPSGVIIGSTRLLKEFLTNPYRHIFISSKIPLLVVMLVVFKKVLYKNLVCKLIRFMLKGSFLRVPQLQRFGT
ncbi:hypothetical protein ES332_A11G194400v1 [Gossypium tomentosum]|uniref:Uncharacterized protein n=1 Tax=Gossypium tomentosum TaxID=34277 RepID=A0A5D2NBE6_GOSTO|nr:hypothetical protein ES332_A11G194400v1 [Gossypium tomentosum]